jgi:hypothetical protein
MKQLLHYFHLLPIIEVATISDVTKCEDCRQKLVIGLDCQMSVCIRYDGVVSVYLMKLMEITLDPLACNHWLKLIELPHFHEIAQIN